MKNVSEQVYEDAWLSAPTMQLANGDYTLFWWSKAVHVIVADALDDLYPPPALEDDPA